MAQINQKKFENFLKIIHEVTAHFCRGFGRYKNNFLLWSNVGAVKHDVRVGTVLEFTVLTGKWEKQVCTAFLFGTCGTTARTTSCSGILRVVGIAPGFSALLFK